MTESEVLVVANEDTTTVVVPVPEPELVKNEVAIEMKLEGANFWAILLAGFRVSASSSNIMDCIEITKMVERYGSFDLSAVMQIGKFKSACTLTINQGQLCNIIGLGISKIMGGKVIEVELRSHYCYICEYNVTVTFEGKVA